MADLVLIFKTTIKNNNNRNLYIRPLSVACSVYFCTNCLNEVECYNGLFLSLRLGEVTSLAEVHTLCRWQKRGSGLRSLTANLLFFDSVLWCLHRSTHLQTIHHKGTCQTIPNWGTVYQIPEQCLSKQISSFKDRKSLENVKCPAA